MKYEWNVSYYYFYPEDHDVSDDVLVSQNINDIANNSLVQEFCNHIIDSNVLVDDAYASKLFVNQLTFEVNIKFLMNLNQRQYQKMTLLNQSKYVLVYSIEGIPLQIPLGFMTRVDN